eukprot:CAMPEP_0202976908 /NCGR_PEP_ID=MMETSP1396-20130829/81603_1 /ASSEMBLY_ACC=CAM_ASM_000872 /TAXON_ID= /ORGANISM="Pseudokeronopsis sp., Strain Brazil" /LENGTH=74 /DNA_ID=CAMNT_0049715063 /DNA_START=94 /DNA_END=318 /DNA_ORIENTATION=-
MAQESDRRFNELFPERHDHLFFDYNSTDQRFNTSVFQRKDSSPRNADDVLSIEEDIEKESSHHIETDYERLKSN